METIGSPGPKIQISQHRLRIILVRRPYVSIPERVLSGDQSLGGRANTLIMGSELNCNPQCNIFLKITSPHHMYHSKRKRLSERASAPLDHLEESLGSACQPKCGTLARRIGMDWMGGKSKTAGALDYAVWMYMLPILPVPCHCSLLC